MLPRSILSWLVLLTLATVTRSEHYHIVPADSTDSCHDYRNGTCFTLEQLVQTDLLSGGDIFTLSFLPGDHVLTEQLLIRNFSKVQITGQNTNTTVVGFHSNGTILFVSNTKLSIEGLGFIGANVGPRNSHKGLIIDGALDVYIKDCYFMDFVLLNQAETHIVKIANTQTATIESTLFMNNTGQALRVEADDVNIKNSEFTRNDGGAVDIHLNRSIVINNILSDLFNYKSAERGGAVEVVSDTVVINWCNFTNNKASVFGGAIAVFSTNVFIFDCMLTNNSAYGGGGAIAVYSSSVSISDCTLTNSRTNIGGGAIGVVNGSVFISNSELTNNSADYGGAIYVYSGSVSISNSMLTNNRATNNGGGAIGAYTHSNVSISNSTLRNNRADTGGAIVISSSSVSISDSTLTNNSADGRGGVITAYSGSVSISDSTLTNNRATSGGGGIFLSESILFVNKPIKVCHNAAQNGGGIYAYSSRIEFQSLLPIPWGRNKQIEIAHNIAENGGGIYAVATTIKLTQSYVNIDSNKATAKGGGVFLQQSSRLYLII